jgi:hypothetical protein
VAPVVRVAGGLVATVDTVPVPDGSQQLGRAGDGTARITVVFDVPVVDAVAFERTVLVPLGWVERTLQSPTGTSAGGMRRAAFVRGDEYLQVTAVPTPPSFSTVTGFAARLTVIVSRGR